jgi:choline dehydrogenase
MALPDIYTEGIASGWKVVDAAKLTAPQTMEADVAIIGSGAGGARRRRDRWLWPD